MAEDPIRNVVIAGGGTAGWMTAAGLATALGSDVSITLVESDAIGTVGVGEATIPQINHLHRFLGLDEARLLQATGATYKLGIEFDGWAGPDAKYLHAFGNVGLPLGLAPFHHYHLRAAAAGRSDDYWAYSLTAQAARRDRFAPLSTVGETRLDGVTYAFHLDALHYATLLREVAGTRGVQRVEGMIERVEQDSETGDITALVLDGGRRITGELFIDCTGFRSLLLGDTMDVPFDDWSGYLPCDRAVVIQSAHGARVRPYTQAMARPTGWQWRIPLQERVGNGHVYSSDHMSDDKAEAILRETLEGEALGEPRVISFQTGIRKKVWERNVIALGLSAGFMEPLESTSIHLVQSALERLIALFPARQIDPVLRDTMNARTRMEWERIRDFLILHYHANGRAGEPFWDECRAIDLPEGLSRKLALFRAGGRFQREDEELFAEAGWVQVMLGQGITPSGWAPAADAMDGDRLAAILSNLRKVIEKTAEALPSQATTLETMMKTSAGQAVQ